MIDKNYFKIIIFIFCFILPVIGMAQSADTTRKGSSVMTQDPKGAVRNPDRSGVRNPSQAANRTSQMNSVLSPAEPKQKPARQMPKDSLSGKEANK